MCRNNQNLGWAGGLVYSLLCSQQEGKWFMYMLRWLEEAKLCRRTRIFAGEQKTAWEGGERQKDERVIGGQGLEG